VGKGIEWFMKARVPFTRFGKAYTWISGILIVASIGLMVVKGFDYSIDFTGGLVYTVEYSDEANHTEQLTGALKGSSLGDAKIRKLGGTALNQYMISLQTDESDEAAVAATGKTLSGMLAGVGAPQIVAQDVVGPTIGSELRRDAILAVILSWLIIAAYIWVRFGKMGLGFGVGAVVTLIHDTIIALGVVSLFGLSFDGTMIAALLTLIGYSINDTIVIYDRIRENKILGKETLSQKIDLSLNQSLSRTIITSITTFFVCVILAIMGGTTIRDFGIIMAVGIVIGTYSSICISSPFLLLWAKRFKTGIG
jgi:SecD/SecF fusion protein